MSNVTEMLKNYTSYKFAVKRYETHNPTASAGIANYTGMSGGEGASELFFAPNARMADMGHTSLEDLMDYQSYKEIVTALDLAIETLSAEEQYIVKKKWIDGVDLSKIADTSHYAYITVRRYHKSAINKLEKCLRFDKFVHIEQVHVMK